MVSVASITSACYRVSNATHHHSAETVVRIDVLSALLIFWLQGRSDYATVNRAEDKGAINGGIIWVGRKEDWEKPVKAQTFSGARRFKSQKRLPRCEPAKSFMPATYFELGAAIVVRIAFGYFSSFAKSCIRAEPLPPYRSGEKPYSAGKLCNGLLRPCM